MLCSHESASASLVETNNMRVTSGSFLCFSSRRMPVPSPLSIAKNKSLCRSKALGICFLVLLYDQMLVATVKIRKTDPGVTHPIVN